MVLKGLGCLLYLASLFMVNPFREQTKFDRVSFYRVFASSSLSQVNEELKTVAACEEEQKEAFEGALLMRKAGLVAIPKDKLNTTTDYLGNRPRPRGVVEKCTWCIHRVRKGQYPKCVEVCPVGARKFGNLLDPNSEIRYILANKRVLILKEELNTQPKFFYYYGL